LRCAVQTSGKQHPAQRRRDGQARRTEENAEHSQQQAEPGGHDDRHRRSPMTDRHPRPVPSHRGQSRYGRGQMKRLRGREMKQPLDLRPLALLLDAEHRAHLFDSEWIGLAGRSPMSVCGGASPRGALPRAVHRCPHGADTRTTAGSSSASGVDTVVTPAPFVMFRDVLSVAPVPPRPTAPAGHLVEETCADNRHDGECVLRDAAAGAWQG
jgi:hypothetical protein